MKVKELREKKLKEGHMKEIFQFIEENYGYSDYDQMIEDLVEEFGITEDEASSLLQDYNLMPDEEKRGMGVDLWGDEYGLCEESIISAEDRKLGYKETDNQINAFKKVKTIADKVGVDLTYKIIVGKTTPTIILDHKYWDGAVRIFPNGALKIGDIEIGKWNDDNFDLNNVDENIIEKALLTLNNLEESKMKESEKIEYSNKKCGVKVVKYTDRFGDYFYAVLKDGSVTEPLDKQGNHRFIDFNDAMAYARSLCESKMNEAEIKEFEGLDVIPVSVEMVEQEIEEVEEGTATGTTWYEVALGYLPTGEVWKEKWIALGCNGVVVGQDSDDFGDLYDVKWHDYDVAELEDYITEPSQEAHDYAFEHSEPVVWGIYRMIDRCMENEGEPVNFEPLNESKLTEGNRVYKYTLKLTQPEGSRYHLTNQNTLKFKTKEEAEERKEKILQYNKSSFEKKGLGIEVVEIEDKPRKQRPKATDDPNFQNPFKVGDILEGDFGYTMTLPVWYEVTKVTPARVQCRKLKDIVIDHDGYGQAGHKKPDLGNYDTRYDDGEVTMTVKKYGTSGDPKRDYTAYLKRGSSYGFRLWDGEPAAFDTYD